LFFLCPPPPFNLVLPLFFWLLWVSSVAYPNLLGTKRLDCCCWYEVGHHGSILFRLIKFQHFSIPAFLESCVPKQLLHYFSFHLSCYLLIKTDIHITVSISHTCCPCIFLFQSIYPAKILKLNFRERKENAWEDSGSDELSVVFPSVIGRFDGADLQVCVNASFIFLMHIHFHYPTF
jgi:hypothetical protein